VCATNQAYSVSRQRYDNWSQEYPRNVPAIVLAASFDIPALLRKLVHAGHSLEASGTDNETPLLRAARLGHLSSVTELLSLGADIDCLDATRETAIERAAYTGNAALVKKLLASGAKITLQANPDWSILMSGAIGGNLEIVQLLVEAGADVNAVSSGGYSALTLATQRGLEDIALYLADRGAVLPATGPGRRAWAVAANRGFASLVKRLILDYKAVARGGLKREDRGPQDSFLEDLSEAPPSSSAEHPAGVRGHDAEEVLSNLNYTRGFRRRYDVLERLDRGSFTEVHLCRNRITDLLYAVKCWKHPFVDDVRAEILALKALKHGNIVRMVDVILEDSQDGIFIVMEYLGKGRSLFDFVVDNNYLTESVARTVISQLLLALEFLVSRL
jgi:hypothetical protein